MGNNRVKIGARILSDDALNKLLPSNKNILDQIRYIRDVAKTEHDNSNNSITPNKKNWDREFDRHFNNIFSILGGRGSGKTSVLLTMKYKIQYVKDSTDIILPLIVPEKMGNVSEVLGCILGLLGDIVAEYDKRNINVYEDKRECQDLFEDCRKKKCNLLREKYNDLLKQHQYTHKDYRDILVKEYVGFSDYVSNSSHVLDSDQKLVVRFEEFIEELLKVKRKDNENDKKLKQEPLIFIFFDDVDLSTDRCVEVLNVILRYLSHSNIVVFVAGNYLTFSEVLTINALKKDDLLSPEMNEVFYSEKINEQKKALDIRKELTQDFLKKAMPPALRYDMPLMGGKAKAEFNYSTENDNISNYDNQSVNNIVYPKLFELIIKTFIDSDYSSEMYEQQKVFRKNFLHYNNDELLYVFYKIFDNTPRGVMNVYYFLHSIQDDRIIVEGDKCLRLRRFLDTIVKSSTILSKYEYEISRIIEIKDSYKDTFIDYKYIETMVEAYENKLFSKDTNQQKDNMNPIDDIVTIFMLAYFIENIKIIETQSGKLEKPHGTDVLCKILNSQNKRFVLYPVIDDVHMLLKMYELISATISQTNIKNLTQHKKNYFLGKYFEVLDNVKGDKLSSFFRKIYFKDKDRKWIDEKIDTIMKHGGGAESILKENIEYVYDIAKNMYLGKERLREIANKLINLDKISFTGSKKVKVINISEKDIQTYIEKGILSNTDVKNYNFGILLDYFDDRLLDFETRLKRVSRIIRLDADIISSYKEMLDRFDDRLFEENDLLKHKDLFINNHHNYMLEEDYKSLLKDLRYMIRGGNRFYPRSYIEFISGFFDKLNMLELELPDDKYSELEIDVNELDKILIHYVIAKTIIDIKNRRNLPDGKSDNQKESFYKMFERLKEELILENNYKGFYDYIIEKESESRKANINVSG